MFCPFFYSRKPYKLVFYNEYDDPVFGQNELGFY